MFNKKKINMGLDIGTRFVKGVCLKPTGGKVLLDRFLLHDLSTANDSYPDANSIESRLPALVEGSQLVNHEVCSVLENSDVAHLAFTLPKLTDKELQAALANELEEQLNMSKDEITYDYSTEEYEENNEKKLKVKVYWVRKDIVLKHISLIQKAKLKPIAVEPAINAQIAMLEFNGYLSPTENKMVVEIGESHTSVSLLHGSSVLFTHNYPLGSGLINTSLKQVIGCNYQEAEALKITAPLDQLEGVAPNEAIEVIWKAYGDIFKNIKDSYEAATADSTVVTSILVLGGVGYAVHIEKALGKFLGVPAQIVNPLLNIEIYDKKNTELGEQLAAKAGYFSTAIGLALRGIN